MSDLLRQAGFRDLRLPLWRARVRIGALSAVLLALVLISVVCAVLVTLGFFDLAPGRVWAALVHPADASRDESLIVWTIRVPRILMGLMIGAALGIAGALMQSVTRNGLADPGLIGVTEGATVAALALLVLAPGVADGWRPAAALSGGLAAAAVVTLIARNVSGLRFVLIGVGVSWFLSSWIAIFIARSGIDDAQRMMLWLTGSLNMASWQSLFIALPWIVGGVLIAVVTQRGAEVAMLGDASARGLGLRLDRHGILQIGASAMLTAGCVSAVGNLGFVGLVAPHVARLALGSGQAALLAGSALTGAALVLVGDAIGRLVFAPLQIPAGIVMAILGVPFVLLLLWQRRDSL